MVCCFEDLRSKEIIHIRSGGKIGFVDDVEFDTSTAKVCSLIVYGRARFFGLFGREEDYIIPWGDIEIIGEDTILISSDLPRRTKKQNQTLKNLLK